MLINTAGVTTGHIQAEVAIDAVACNIADGTNHHTAIICYYPMAIRSVSTRHAMSGG